MLVEQLAKLLKQNIHEKIEKPASGWALLSSPLQGNRENHIKIRTKKAKIVSLSRATENLAPQIRILRT
jgi:hypothetical protein